MVIIKYTKGMAPYKRVLIQKVFKRVLVASKKETK